jgi:predicted nucleotide-binding protein
VASVDDWEITHDSGRLYLLSNRLDHDARQVTVNARTRTTGKPDADVHGIEEFSIGEYQIIGADEGVRIDLEPRWPGAPLPYDLVISWYDEYGDQIDLTLSVPSPSGATRRRPRPDLRPPIPAGFATRAGGLAARTANVPRSVSPPEYAEPVPTADPKKVFVVVGRNTTASRSMFDFLRAIGLNPIEWNRAISATGSGSPYIGQALDAAFAMVQAVVVLMTPDDIAQLAREHASGDDDPDLEPKGQARPNVLFEAGMAFGHHPDRTILVELGALRPFSDVAGRHTVRLDDSARRRHELANRLKDAGCDVDDTGSDWLETGDFTPPKVPGGPRGRRLPSSSSTSKTRLDARYLHRTSGSDRITIQNVGSEEVFDLTSPNLNEFRGRIDGFPVPRLPVGKSATLIATAAAGRADRWDLIVDGRTASGEEFSESLYLDLNG